MYLRLDTRNTTNIEIKTNRTVTLRITNAIIIWPVILSLYFSLVYVYCTKREVHYDISGQGL